MLPLRLICRLLTAAAIIVIILSLVLFAPYSNALKPSEAEKSKVVIDQADKLAGIYRTYLASKKTPEAGTDGFSSFATRVGKMSTALGPLSVVFSITMVLLPKESSPELKAIQNMHKEMLQVTTGIYTAVNKLADNMGAIFEMEQKKIGLSGVNIQLTTTNDFAKMYFDVADGDLSDLRRECGKLTALYVLNTIIEYYTSKDDAKSLYIASNYDYRKVSELMSSIESVICRASVTRDYCQATEENFMNADYQQQLTKSNVHTNMWNSKLNDISKSLWGYRSSKLADSIAKDGVIEADVRRFLTSNRAMDHGEFTEALVRQLNDKYAFTKTRFSAISYSDSVYGNDDHFSLITGSNDAFEGALHIIREGGRSLYVTWSYCAQSGNLDGLDTSSPKVMNDDMKDKSFYDKITEMNNLKSILRTHCVKVKSKISNMGELTNGKLRCGDIKWYYVRRCAGSRYTGPPFTSADDIKNLKDNFDQAAKQLAALKREIAGKDGALSDDKRFGGISKNLIKLQVQVATARVHAAFEALNSAVGVTNLDLFKSLFVGRKRRDTASVVSKVAGVEEKAMKYYKTSQSGDLAALRQACANAPPDSLLSEMESDVTDAKLTALFKQFDYHYVKMHSYIDYVESLVARISMARYHCVVVAGTSGASSDTLLGRISRFGELLSTYRRSKLIKFIVDWDLYALHYDRFLTANTKLSHADFTNKLQHELNEKFGFFGVSFSVISQPQDFTWPDGAFKTKQPNTANDGALMRSKQSGRTSVLTWAQMQGDADEYRRMIEDYMKEIKAMADALNKATERAKKLLEIDKALVVNSTRQLQEIRVIGEKIDKLNQWDTTAQSEKLDQMVDIFTQVRQMSDQTLSQMNSELDNIGSTADQIAAENQRKFDLLKGKIGEVNQALDDQKKIISMGIDLFAERHTQTVEKTTRLQNTLSDVYAKLGMIADNQKEEINRLDSFSSDQLTQIGQLTNVILKRTGTEQTKAAADLLTASNLLYNQTVTSLKSIQDRLAAVIDEQLRIELLVRYGRLINRVEYLKAWLGKIENEAGNGYDPDTESLERAKWARAVIFGYPSGEPIEDILYDLDQLITGGSPDNFDVVASPNSTLTDIFRGTIQAVGNVSVVLRDDPEKNTFLAANRASQDARRSDYSLLQAFVLDLQLIERSAFSMAIKARQYIDSMEYLYTVKMRILPDGRNVRSITGGSDEPSYRLSSSDDENRRIRFTSASSIFNEMNGMLGRHVVAFDNMLKSSALVVRLKMPQISRAVTLTDGEMTTKLYGVDGSIRQLKLFPTNISGTTQGQYQLMGCRLCPASSCLSGSLSDALLTQCSFQTLNSRRISDLPTNRPKTQFSYPNSFDEEKTACGIVPSQPASFSAVSVSPTTRQYSIKVATGFTRVDDPKSEVICGIEMRKQQGMVGSPFGFTIYVCARDTGTFKYKKIPDPTTLKSQDLTPSTAVASLLWVRQADGWTTGIGFSVTSNPLQANSQLLNIELESVLY